MFKVNNKDRRRSGVFIVKVLTYCMLSSSISIVKFEHVITGWVQNILKLQGFPMAYSKKCC